MLYSTSYTMTFYSFFNYFFIILYELFKTIFNILCYDYFMSNSDFFIDYTMTFPQHYRMALIRLIIIWDTILWFLFFYMLNWIFLTYLPPFMIFFQHDISWLLWIFYGFFNIYMSFLTYITMTFLCLFDILWLNTVNIHRRETGARHVQQKMTLPLPVRREWRLHKWSRRKCCKFKMLTLHNVNNCRWLNDDSSWID